MVGSLKQQLVESKGHAHEYSQQVEEMRTRAAAAGKAGRELQEQVQT